MKHLFSLILFFTANFMLFSCLSDIGTDKKKIEANEKKLVTDRKNTKLAQELEMQYENFIQKYPGDSNLPHMLFEAAQLDIFPLNKNEAAITHLETLYKKYPDSRFEPNALFKSAYLNEKVLHKFDKAKEQYLLFVKTYPKHELAGQAKDLAAMTGMSDEEQFKQVMAKHNLIEDSVKNQKKVAR